MGNGSVFIEKVQPPPGSVIFIAQRSAHMTEIAPDPCMPHMLAGHQYATRRGTDGTSCVGLGKAQTICSKLVDIRGFDLFLTVTSQVTVPQVIGHYEDDVGPAASQL
jgi:hypothetical protein